MLLGLTAGHVLGGLAGGEAGGPSRNAMVRNGGTRPLPGKITMSGEEDTVIIHDQAGGGGFGDPLTRDAALVLEDIHDGKITPAYARERHGIVLGANGLVDEAGSQSLRRAKTAASRTGVGHGA